MAKKSAFNNFQIGDFVEFCMNPNDPEPEWLRWGNSTDGLGRKTEHRLRDLDDISKIREIVETSGACLGWGSASLFHAGQGYAYRTVTP